MYVGLQTAGSYAVLYSNLIVEREHDDDSNHYIMSPLKRYIRSMMSRIVFWNWEWDLVVVVASDVDSIQRQLVIAPVAPFVVFAGLVEKKGWHRAGMVIMNLAYGCRSTGECICRLIIIYLINNKK